MSLGLNPTRLLLPHEKSIPSLSQKLASEIKSLGYVIHPVIADAETNVIVDGTHRVEALRMLGAEMTPVFRVDYFGERVMLETWARILHEPVVVDEISSLAMDFGLDVDRMGCRDIMAGDTLLEYPFVFISGGEALGIVGEKTVLFRLVEWLDDRFKMAGLEYVREGELLRRLGDSSLKAGYLIPRLEKKTVVEMAVRGALLPPKSTRHIVVDRPMFIFCPLSLLMAPDEERFKEWIGGSMEIRLPPGVTVDRHYEEPIVIHYFGRLRHLYPPEILNRLPLGP